MYPDKHWLALYLTGKYPGKAITPDKVRFFDVLQRLNPTVFSDDKIRLYDIKDDFELYFSFLWKVERDFPSDYGNFLLEIGIPEDLIQISVLFPRRELKKDFEELKNMSLLKTKNSSQKKWKALEDFLRKFFWFMPGIWIHEIKQAKDEQIDLILKNNVNRPSWIQLQSPLIMWEAKNYDKNTGTDVLNTLDGKINNHENFVRVGFVIALNDFTAPTEIQLVRKNGKHILVLINGAQIEQLLDSSIDPIDWLEEKIFDSFK